MRADLSTSELPDQELMRRSAAGDRDAFAAVYHRHHASIYRFARLMTGSNTMAEDVVQEVFLALMRTPARYDASRSSLSTYLYGAARNQTRRRIFRERRFVAIDDGGDLACGNVASAVERRSEVAQLRRAILSLPSRYREVVALCDLQEVTYADAATALGCAIGTVRSRLHRARQLLMKKLRHGDAETTVARSTLRCPV